VLAVRSSFRMDIEQGFVLTEPDNAPANALYEALGGALEGKDGVWKFRYEAS